MQVKIQDLSVHLDKEPILKNIDLEIENGEFLSLLGPSGCGKTTLLKSIAGLIPAQAGSIHLGEKDITHMPAHKRGTTIVFQDLRLFPHMSVAKNLAYPMKLKGLPRNEQEKKIQSLLAKVQLSGYENRYPATLSGGQQQRVALLRAFASEPALLLLDEPFSALDQALRQEARQLVKELQEDFNVTTLLVTHDQEEALSISDRVAMIFDGEIHQVDSPEKIFTRPSTRDVAEYFDGRSFLEGEIKAGKFHPLSESEGFAELPAPEKKDGRYQMMILHSDLHPDPNGPLTFAIKDIRFLGTHSQLILENKDGFSFARQEQNCSLKKGEELNFSYHSPEPIYFPCLEVKNV